MKQQSKHLRGLNKSFQIKYWVQWNPLDSDCPWPQKLDAKSNREYEVKVRNFHATRGVRLQSSTTTVLHPNSSAYCKMPFVKGTPSVWIWNFQECKRFPSQLCWAWIDDAMKCSTSRNNWTSKCLIIHNFSIQEGPKKIGNRNLK